MAEEIKYNHNSPTISEIKKKTDFTVLVPKKIPNDWTLEIKTTLGVMLHYMNSQDTKLMVAIHQKKEIPISDADFPDAEIEDINGCKGYFQEWIDNGKVDKHGEIVSGGLLQWAQNGTNIMMTSWSLSKDEMLKIARSMD